MSSNKVSEKQLTYRDAGVDIDKANELITNIKQIAKKTKRPGVIHELGSFGALFQIPPNLKEPLLVSGTDGVGTKLKLAHTLNCHDSIGIDLVAMCANDILCHGAEPLFFLDYYATGKLNPEQATKVIQGIGQGCTLAGAALIGGETAEMPTMYKDDEYDLAGFCVGVVERSKLIDGQAAQVGDAIIGIGSSGPHSNGYALIHKVFERSGARYDDLFEGKSWAQVLLTPTRLYVKAIQALLKQVDVRGLAHITGGGLQENVPRCLPLGTKARIDSKSWELPPIFQWLQTEGNISTEEMYRTFNMGVGMIAIVPQEDVETTLGCLKAAEETAWVIGTVETTKQDRGIVIE